MNMQTSVSRKIFMAFNCILLVGTALICILPFINQLAVSFSHKNAVAANQVIFWPIGFNLSAYDFILKGDAFMRALWVSIQRVAIGVPVNLLLIILTAYPLSKSKENFRFRSIYSWFFVVTILFSAGLIPTYMIVRFTGLIDSIWALVLPGALPVFSMLVVMNYMRSLPPELEEAAYVDGASHVRTLVYIILPVSTPTLATVTLFSFVAHWNSWFDGQIYMNRIQNYPLQSYLQTMVINVEAFFRNSTNVSADIARYIELVSARTSAAAQMFLAMIPILIIYPFLQKYFATGLVLGSVKG
ncbi:MAG: carbohydrate ABC transporter permease [Oscillospiraceae bacterium]|nr:carbohydrate ABC transporter permease [Oscillospiraceae bacterium]